MDESQAHRGEYGLGNEGPRGLERGWSCKYTRVFLDFSRSPRFSKSASDWEWGRRAGAGRTQAKGDARPPSIQGVWSPVVGTGAAYEIQDNKNQKHAMEMTIVGKETVNGKDAYWLEYGMQAPDSGATMYRKMLVAQDRDNVITERMIMQVPGQPQPMEMSMSIQAPQATVKKNQEADFRQKAQHVGTETISVPAGTFVCEHYRMTDGSGDVWFSPKVTPWGMVKYSGQGTTLVLLKTITGAKDHITSTPVKFDPTEIMRQVPRP